MKQQLIQALKIVLVWLESKDKPQEQNIPLLTRPQKQLVTKMNESGIELLKQLEGYRAKPYFCSANQRTIGYGYAIKEGEKFEYLTKEQAEKLLRMDVEIFEDVVNKHQFNLNQYQFDALVCLIFNIGQTQFEKSKTFKHLAVGDHAQALKEWAGFNKERRSGTKGELITSVGLSNRWSTEIALFKKEVTTDVALAA